MQEKIEDTLQLKYPKRYFLVLKFLLFHVHQMAQISLVLRGNDMCLIW